MPRLTIYLPINERDALYQLARREYRNPREQAAVIIRHELERRGLLAVEAPVSKVSLVDEVSHE